MDPNDKEGLPFHFKPSSKYPRKNERRSLHHIVAPVLIGRFNSPSESIESNQRDEVAHNATIKQPKGAKRHRKVVTMSEEEVATSRRDRASSDKRTRDEDEPEHGSSKKRKFEQIEAYQSEIINLATRDIWTMIFSRFLDLSDAINVKSTCKMFRDFGDVAFNPLNTRHGLEILDKQLRRSSQESAVWLIKDKRVWDAYVQKSGQYFVLRKICENALPRVLCYLLENKILDLSHPDFSNTLFDLCDTRRPENEDYTACFQMILKTGLVDPNDGDGMCFTLACRSGQSALIRALMNDKTLDLGPSEHGRCVLLLGLMSAISYGRDKSVKRMLKDKRFIPDQVVALQGIATGAMLTLILEHALGAEQYMMIPLILERFEQPEIKDIAGLGAVTTKLVESTTYRPHGPDWGQIGAIRTLFIRGIYDPKDFTIYIRAGFRNSFPLILEVLASTQDERITTTQLGELFIELCKRDRVFLKQKGAYPHNADETILSAIIKNPRLDFKSLAVDGITASLGCSYPDNFVFLLDRTKDIDSESLGKIFLSLGKNNWFDPTFNQFVSRFGKQIPARDVHECVITLIQEDLLERLMTVFGLVDVDFSRNNDEILLVLLENPKALRGVCLEAVLKSSVDLSRYDHAFMHIACTKLNWGLLKAILSTDRLDLGYRESVCLDWAVSANSIDAVDLLLKDGRADPTARNFSALLSAHHNRNRYIIDKFLEDKRVNPKKLGTFPEWYEDTFHQKF